MNGGASCRLCKYAPAISHTLKPKSTTLPQIGKFLIGFIAIFHLPFAVDDLLLSTI
jgi:hypothetical protein